MLSDEFSPGDKNDLINKLGFMKLEFMEKVFVEAKKRGEVTPNQVASAIVNKKIDFDGFFIDYVLKCVVE